MRAYWFDNKAGDQRLPHDSGRDATPADLAALGIQYFRPSSTAEVDEIAAARSYAHRDEITVSPKTMGGAYESKIAAFFVEHLHEDEEIRYILEGGGFFDVRNADDDWVRIALEVGDLLIMPAGIYHRFTTDMQDYTKAMRLFKDEPRWTPLNRGAETDTNVFRKDYLLKRHELSTA